MEKISEFSKPIKRRSDPQEQSAKRFHSASQTVSVDNSGIGNNFSASSVAIRKNFVQPWNVNSPFTQPAPESLSNRNIIDSDAYQDKLPEETSEVLNEPYSLIPGNKQFEIESQNCHDEILTATGSMSEDVYFLIEKALCNTSHDMDNQPYVSQDHNETENTIDYASSLAGDSTSSQSTHFGYEIREPCGVNVGSEISNTVSVVGNPIKRSAQPFGPVATVTQSSEALLLTTEKLKQGSETVKSDVTDIQFIDVPFSRKNAVIEQLQNGKEYRVNQLIHDIKQKYPGIKDDIWHMNLSTHISAYKCFHSMRTKSGKAWKYIPEEQTDTTKLTMPIKINLAINALYDKDDSKVINKPINVEFSYKHAIVEQLQFGGELLQSEVTQRIENRFPNISQVDAHWKVSVSNALQSIHCIKKENIINNKKQMRWSMIESKKRTVASKLTIVSFIERKPERKVYTRFGSVSSQVILHYIKPCFVKFKYTNAIIEQLQYGDKMSF
ncbi:MAG: hypothetical protein KAG53_03560 [Endozoicomonadaceae bacterium]|nr:hypothetical protein [Endozoicomonadaceae bacterium]